MDMPLKRDPLWATSKHGRKSPRPRRPQKQRLQSPSPKGSRWPTGPRSKELGAPMECPTTALSWASPHPDLARAAAALEAISPGQGHGILGPDFTQDHHPWTAAAHPTTNPHTFSPSLTRCWPVCSPSYKMELESTAQPTSLGSRELRGVMAGFPRSFSLGSFVQESKVMTWLGKSSQTRG